MYACVLETGRGFFEGVCARNDRPRISADAPRLTICELRSVHVERHGRSYEGKRY
jgi:hypothetical protein